MGAVEDRVGGDQAEIGPIIFRFVASRRSILSKIPARPASRDNINAFRDVQNVATAEINFILVHFL